MESRLKQYAKAAAACLCGAVFFVSGCKTLEQIAPPVDDRLESVSSADSLVLMRGRSIYLKQCATCHVAEPVHDYSAQRWAEILPVMNKESKLTPIQAMELKLYIDACLADGPRQP